MSTVVAAAIIGDRIMHCVDYDRPVWVSPGSADHGIVPDPEHFLVDGLIAWASPILDLGIFSWNRFGLESRQFPTDAEAPPDLATAREAIYAAKDPWLLCVFWGARERAIMDDIGRLSMRVSVADADHSFEPRWP